jgi:hypothetical protein
MRVMVIVKSTKSSEAGVMPDATAMAKYNDELVRAGVLLAADGLQPSSKGRRLVCAGGTKNVFEGPFAETKELIAGFWLWQVKNMDEAVEWARRCPDPGPGEQAVLEIRPVLDAADAGEQLTPERRDLEQRIRTETGRHKQS